MKVGIDMGHTLSGAGTGASSQYAKETDKNREVGKRLIELLKAGGHTVVNCTVDNSNNDLYDRVKLANTQTLDLFISLHLNAYKVTTDAMGVETYIYNGSYSGKESNRAIAQKIQSELVKAIGWKDRKVKEANYYVLRETIAPAVLIELGFCDSKKDMELWNTEKIAKALYKTITGTEAPVSNSTNNTSSGATYWRVITGSYTNKDNALNQKEKLEKAGFSSFLEAFIK